MSPALRSESPLDRNGGAVEGLRNLWKTPAAWTLAVVLAVLLVSFAAASAWKSERRISRVTIIGASILSQEDLTRIAGIEEGSLLDTLDILAVRQRLARNPYVMTVAVNRVYPDAVDVTITERLPVAGFLNMGQVMYLDRDGIVLPAVGRANADLPMVTGIPGLKSPKPGSPIGAPKYFEAMAILDAAVWVDSSAYTEISEVNLSSEGETAIFWGEAAVRVKFGSGDELRKMQRLWAFWQQYVRDDGATELEYLDVRFNDQVVAKWKGEPRRTNDKL